MQIPILYQDAAIVVVNKPASIPTHAADPADPYAGDALRMVQAQTGLPYLGMHQRLDAETSGVLLFSAQREANRSLAASFEGGQVRKVYLALVHGRPPWDEAAVDAPIVRDRQGRYRVTTARDRLGQTAVTRFRVLGTTTLAAGPSSAGSGRGRASSRIAGAAKAPDAQVSLLQVTPETGRTHQIRVHLAHSGLPVVGDALYGPADRPAPRLCLHAHQLTVTHPTTGQELTFTAPPPDLFGRLATGLPELALAASGLHVRQAANRAADPLRQLLRLACERRAPLAADPHTTIYRLVHGAADAAAGLSVDRFGDALVMSLYDEEAQLALDPSLESLAADLCQITGGRSVYIKHRPRQASRVPEEQLAALTPSRPIYGPEMGEFVAAEEGLAFLIRPAAGLSVGLFPDMREGRARVRAWAAGRRVLNCFAYTCGFGVAALAGGAGRVLNLDLSKAALAWGQENYRANGFTADPHDFVYGDVFDWLARLARRRERFDLVILDPPGFSTTKTRRFTVARDYGELVALAEKVSAPDSLLLACCNVAELPWRAFRERVLSGLAGSGRPAEVVGVYHEPAIDFPTPAGLTPYLKILAMRLG